MQHLRCIPATTDVPIVYTCLFSKVDIHSGTCPAFSFSQARISQAFLWPARQCCGNIPNEPLCIPGKENISALYRRKRQETRKRSAPWRLSWERLLDYRFIQPEKLSVFKFPCWDIIFHYFILREDKSLATLSNLRTYANRTAYYSLSPVVQSGYVKRRTGKRDFKAQKPS